MEVGRGKGRQGSVRRQEGGTTSKQHASADEHEGDDGDRRGKKFARVEREGQWAEEDTSCGNEYVPEESGSGNGGSNESLDTEPEYSHASEGLAVGEGTSIGRRRRRMMMPKLEVLWRAFEEENLMESSGSDYEAGDWSGAEDSSDVSLVEESDVADIVANVTGGEEDREGTAGEGSSRRDKGSTKRKVVRSEGRQLRRKARGDGVVLGGNPLKGEKGNIVTVKGRCTLDSLVTLNSRLSDYQKDDVRGSVFGTRAEVLLVFDEACESIPKTYMSNAVLGVCGY